ncbi:MAG: SPOR domain-containing protein [Pseudomonadota bacterium]
MAKQLNTDEAFKLKNQARHRLIGAVALMVAVVVFLPMVFDSEPDALVGNIELRIPDKSEVPPFHPETASESAVAPAAEAASTVAAPVDKPLAPAVVETKPATPKPVESAPIEAKPAASKPAESKSAPVVAKPAPAPVAKKPSATQKAPTSGWVLQVGAYSREEAGRQMYDSLKQKGFPAYTEKVSGMLRVRVGSYPSREAAEKVKQKLEAIGLHPNVIDLG